VDTAHQFFPISGSFELAWVKCSKGHRLSQGKAAQTNEQAFIFIFNYLLTDLTGRDQYAAAIEGEGKGGDENNPS